MSVSLISIKFLSNVCILVSGVLHKGCVDIPSITIITTMLTVSFRQSLTNRLKMCTGACDELQCPVSTYPFYMLTPFCFAVLICRANICSQGFKTRNPS